MFAVVAVVIGLMTALSITGYGLFDIFKTSSTNTAPAITPVHSSNGSNGSNGSNAGNIINCTDTDGGIEPYIFGIVKYGGKTYSDFCWKNGNQTNQTNATNVLAEFYCWNNKAKRSLIHCPYGCANGACRNITNAAVNPTLVDKSPGYTIDEKKAIVDCFCGGRDGNLCAWGLCSQHGACNQYGDECEWEVITILED